MNVRKRRILVIKLGALGDFILATGPFAAIRTAHPHDEIVLLTTAPFAEIRHRQHAALDRPDEPCRIARRHWRCGPERWFRSRYARDLL